MKLIPLAVLLLSAFPTVKADFGDTVDPTFNCPALTTCAQVCVATVAQCPPEMTCPDGLTLCVDGSCAAFCDPTLESPCKHNCAPVACHRVDNNYDQCLASYGSLYDFAVACGAEEEETATKRLTGKEPVFILGWLWVTAVTLAILGWCAYNQRIDPVEGSTKKLRVDEDDSTGDHLTLVCTQTGYKTSPIGAVLYVLTVITYWGFSLVLAYLTIQYYVYNGPQVDRTTLRFQDEEQLLYTWIIVWTLGFVWCLALKWPYSIGSLFLRRCALKDATHVAVFLQNKTGKSKDTVVISNPFVSAAKNTMELAFDMMHAAMAFIFSDVDASLRKEGVYKYCEVKEDQDGTRSFVFMLRRYNLISIHTNPEDIGGESATEFYGEGSDLVFSPGAWTVAKTLGEIAALGNNQVGLTIAEVNNRVRIIGKNSIEMEEPSFLNSLSEEFLKPFYTFQLFLVWSWMPLYYYYMAILIGSTIVLSAITVATFHYRNLRNLFQITHVSGTAEVLRNGTWMVVDQISLVPGDIVKIQPGITYTDMVLLAGDNTILDESALTGEATPQVKTPIDPTNAADVYSPTAHKRQTISAGTTVMEADNATAIVMKTASYTAKGELLREIFNFRRHSFKFDYEVYVVMGILIVYAIVGFLVVIKFVNDSAVVGFFYGAYVVAATIPPLLPTTFTVSVGVSDVRLSQKRIACANSESILIAGKVKMAFFDKTGTLTEQGLSYQSARSATDWSASESISEDLAMAMACCHSLVRSKAGELIGNPVDRAMITRSNAKLGEEGNHTVITDSNGNRLKIVRHFDFDHHRMTQSVIVRLPNGTYVAFVKGSGESIEKLCKPESMPSNFRSSLSDSAAAGIYQISVATKPIDGNTDTITRDEVETGCSFVGVLNFLNAIRPETFDVIRELKEGSVESVVVTGDHTLTGVKIAREAGILTFNKPTVIGRVTEGSDEIYWTTESGDPAGRPIDSQLTSGEVEIALSGAAWQVLLKNDPKHAKFMAPFVRVYGRCTPHDKVSVVDTFVELGMVTLMCGDGGNDCGALKAAHVGVALSDAEASIVSPFTSMDRTITSVVEVLREGRCALASALAVYKYIIMYGQITTMNQIINAYYQITFAEWNWVFIDGVWPIVLAYTLPLSNAARKLPRTRPTASILGLQTVSSVVGMIFFNLIFTFMALGLLSRQPWYECRKWVPTDLLNALVIGDNYESEVIFLVTGAQYLSTGIALNFGYEFRRSWLHNYHFVACIVIFFLIHMWITFVPSQLSCFFRVNCENENTVRGVTGGGVVIPIQNAFNTTLMPEGFDFKIFAIIVFNTAVVSCYEYYIVNGIRRGGKRGYQKPSYSSNDSVPSVEVTDIV